MPDRILYERQQELQLSCPRSVTVAGCGGIGSWVAIFLAMSGIPNIFLFDNDVLEESNRNRLPFCQGSLDKPKVEALRDFIIPLRPEATVVAVNAKLEGVLLEIQVGASDVIFECTDSSRAQHIIYNACKAVGRTFIRAGYDGTHITVTSNISGWVRSNEDNEQYTVRPSWVVPAVTVAALAVGKMMKYYDQEVSLDISEIGIPVLQRRSRITPRCNQRGGERTGVRDLPLPPRPARPRRYR